MNNCKPTITYSDSQEVFERIGAIITSDVIKNAMAGKGFPEIAQSLKNMQNIAIRTNLCERNGINPTSGARIVEDRIVSANYKWLKQFEDMDLNDPRIIKDFNEQIELIAEDFEETDVEIQDTVLWYFEEKLVKLFCVKDSDPDILFIPDGDEFFLFGDLMNGQTKVGERELKKEGVDTGDVVKINSAYKPQLIEVGQNKFTVSQNLIEDDGIGDADLDDLKKELGKVKELIGKAAAADIEKFIKKTSSSSSATNEAIKKILFEVIARLVLKGLDIVVRKLVDNIGSWFGPDFFTPIQFVVIINYDGSTPPEWSFKTTSEGKTSNSETYYGQVSVTPKNVKHKEEDKGDDGEYISTNILRVFRLDNVA